MASDPIPGCAAVEPIRRARARVALARGAASCCIAAIAIAAHAGAATSPPDTGYAVVHPFDKDTRGNHPRSGVVAGADGALYGTAFMSTSTTYGGPNFGAIFRMAPNGTTTSLHGFAGTDGCAPAAALTLASDGNFYGEAAGGGDYGGGTAFRMSPAGSFQVLHSFGGPDDDGFDAYSGALVEGADHAFYGTQAQGGPAGFGTAFRLAADGTVTVLHAFAGPPGDGAYPRGQLMLASDGNFYGTTLCGGVHDAARACQGGTVYRLTAQGAYTLMFSFDGTGARQGGYQPQSAPAERGGSLYGTTTRGGRSDAGTVFKMSLAGGTPSILHAFHGGHAAQTRDRDGAEPVGQLLAGDDGALYGTTSHGGKYTGLDPEGDGILFRIDAADAYAIVRSFGADAFDGMQPLAGLARGPDGRMYGTTAEGGANLMGVVFRIAPDSSLARGKTR